MSNKMIIDSSHPEETRVVVVKGNRLEEFDFESQHKRQIRGNIYLAKVTRVEPSLQAAFVDYGGNRHGFLAFSEIHPDYYQIPLADRQALLEEEAALAEAEDDDEQEEQTSGRSRRGRRRRGRGRRQGNGHDKQASIPAAEPVAMDAILAAWEESVANADTSDDDEDSADAPEANGRVVAAAVNGSDQDVVSEAPDSDDDDDTVDAAADGSDNDGDDDSDDSFDDVGEDDAMEDTRPRRRPSRRQYKIQEVIKRRQIILVQVVKEERGNKGAALTTYMSLAGRYSVLMPNTARGGGISRKITASADRKRLKDLVKKLDVPKGMGVILRTAGANRTQNEIERDYEYLMRLWDNVRDLTLSSSAPALVYEEGSLIKRSIRDLYNKDIGDIVVAGEAGYREARDFMKMLMPSQTSQVKPWKDTAPILARTGIEAQLDKLIHPQVTLKSGGYIIINQTEALVAIDVNSGKSTREHSIEKTALATNLEAAEEVARQLRLRDLAGLIVIDFIDMEENRNNRAVEKKLKECLKNDRARIQVGRISHFGLLEMSRQRMRASVLESTMQVCPHCGGTGYVRSPQSVALHVIRSLEEHLLRNSKYDVTVRTMGDTALYILNNKRDTLAEMEARFGVAIEIAIDNEVGIEMFAIDRGAVSERPKATSDAVGIGDWDDDTEEASSDEYADVEARDTGDDEDEDGRSKRRRRRRRRGRDQRPDAEGGEAETEARASEDEYEDDDGQSGRRRKRRSRGRRGGRNRRGPRIPAAEPVGPLADLIAAEAAEAAKQAAEEAETQPLAADDSQAEATPAPNGDARPAEAAPGTVTEPAETETTAIAAPDEAEESAPAAAAETAPDEADSVDASTDTDDEPERVRATEETLNLDVEPVVVSDNGEDAPKKKRAGWWARGKSWF